VAAHHLADDRLELLHDLVAQEAPRDEVGEQRARDGLDVVGEPRTGTLRREGRDRVQLVHRATQLRRLNRRERRESHLPLRLETDCERTEARDPVLQYGEQVAVPRDDPAFGQVRHERVHVLEVREDVPCDRRRHGRAEGGVDEEGPPGLAHVDVHTRHR
jgi:hypothetical protein